MVGITNRKSIRKRKLIWNFFLVNNEWDWIDGNPATADRGYTWKTYAERLEEAGVG
jgi:hypothetical protein